MNSSEISAKLKACLVQLLFANGYNSPGMNCTCRISFKATLVFMAIKRYSIKMTRLSFKMVKKNKNKKAPQDALTPWQTCRVVFQCKTQGKD